MKKRLALLLAMILVLASFTGVSAKTMASDDTVLSMAITREPGTIDSAKSDEEFSGMVLNTICEGLLRNNNGKIVPGIAESWNLSKDGLKYTFQLRSSMWSDGKPVTAKDFEYAFRRFLDPKTGALFADTLYCIQNAEKFNNGKLADPTQLGVKAVDEKTFEIKLERKVPYFLTILSTSNNLYPVRQDLVEKHGAKYASDESKLITNGPFQLQKWAHESELVLVKNPKYWNKNSIKLEGIKILIIGDANTISNMYDSGEIDYNPSVPVTLLAKYPKAKSAMAGSIKFLQFNLRGTSKQAAKVLSNLNFRKALSYSINRQAVVQSVAGKASFPAGRFVLPSITGVSKKFVQEYPLAGIPLTGDLAKAKAYFAKALKELNTTADKLPKLTYICMQGIQAKAYAEAFQDTWNKVLGYKNLDIKILPVPQAIQAGMKGEYDIYLQSLGGVADDASTIMKYWVIGNDINWTGWADKNYTNMFKVAGEVSDQKKRLSTIFYLEKYLLDKGPLAPLCYNGVYFVHKDNVSNININPVSGETELIYAVKK